MPADASTAAASGFVDCSGVLLHAATAQAQNARARWRSCIVVLGKGPGDRRVRAPDSSSLLKNAQRSSTLAATVRSAGAASKNPRFFNGLLPACVRGDHGIDRGGGRDLLV